MEEALEKKTFDAIRFLEIYRQRTAKVYAKGWTPARAEAQRQRCLASKPWRKSTGPKTPEGKSISCMNARTHGFYDACYLELHKQARKILRERSKSQNKTN